MAMEEKPQLAQKSPQGGYSILLPQLHNAVQNLLSEFSEIFKSSHFRI